MKIAAAWAALATFAGAGVLSGATHLVRGSDRATMLMPTGVRVEAYSNAGYRLAVEDAVAEVTVDLAPLASRQAFEVASVGAARSAEARLARAVVAGAKTRYEAVSRILGWIAANVRYELDRSQAQDASAVLGRRTAYCTGYARLAVALLSAVGIPAREVAGYVVDELPGGRGSGFHRWIEVYYDDRGWVFSDPQRSQHFVAATYLRLASSAVENEEPGEALLLSRDNTVEQIDLVAATPLSLVLARGNSDVRRSAALRVRAPGFPGAKAELIGPGTRRTVVAIEDGEALFLGLVPATYEVALRSDGRLEARRWITIDGPVLANLEIAEFAGPSRSGGGR